MTRIVGDEPSRVAAFVGSRLGIGIVSPFVALGLERDGELVAGAILNCYTGADIQVTLAADRGAVSRRFLRALGEYVLDVAGCVRATVETEQSAVADMARRLGGEIEGLKRDAFGPGRHALLVGILRADWRF